jgi:hypothetical protein
MHNHKILEDFNIQRENIAFQLAMRRDEELAAIICGLGHQRFEGMTLAEMKKDDTFAHYLNKGRVYLFESAVGMIKSIK